MFREIGVPELLIILVIILLLFGVGRVSQVGKELGSAISSFRKGLSESADDNKVAPGKDETKKA
jgi:sec-independent protein translocase protein TatA